MQLMKLVKFFRKTAVAAAIVKAFTSIPSFVISSALALGAGALIGRALSNDEAEDATFQSGILTKKARGGMNLTTLDPADQVIVGTNLMGQGGGEPQQPVINLSNVKLTTDKFANRTVFSSGLDEQTAFS